MENKNNSIETCRFCKFLGPVFELPEDVPPEAIADLEGKYFHCKHEESPCEAVPLHYGCNLWEKNGTMN